MTPQQQLNELINELKEKKTVKVEQLLPRLRKIKRAMSEPVKESEVKDSFGNPIEKGSIIKVSNSSKEKCVEYAKTNSQGDLKFTSKNGDCYYIEGLSLSWDYCLSYKAYKANPDKYNKLLKG